MPELFLGAMDSQNKKEQHILYSPLFGGTGPIARQPHEQAIEKDSTAEDLTWHLFVFCGTPSIHVGAVKYNLLLVGSSH